MQKLSWKTMDMLYKSCSVFHKESNKIGVAFIWIFYEFSKFQLNGFTIEDSILQTGPWNFSKVHKYALGSCSSKVVLIPKVPNPEN
jgi:hypothetical protein